MIGWKSLLALIVLLVVFLLGGKKKRENGIAKDPHADTSWTGLSSDGDYLLALRADGRIDRATIGTSPSRSASHGYVGDEISFDKIDNPIPEFMTLVVPIICSIGFIPRRRRRLLCKKS